GVRSDWCESPDGLDGPGWPWHGIIARSALVAPLTAGEHFLGVIVALSPRHQAYTIDDLNVLAAVADQAAVAIEKARLQKEAAETRALRQLNMLKAEFISTVSHELRSPLTPIVGFAELLSMSPNDPASVREMAGEIYRHGQHMQKLVDDLLDVSRMEAGRFRVELVEVDLLTLLR